jgi:GH15 family glucan-1,4-alpha-glucosidase
MSDNRSEPSLELGVVGNSVLSALIDARGRIVWCCYPRLDGDPIFCSLLDGARGAEAGFLDLEIDEFASTEQHYVRNTAILATTLTDAKGQSVRITDFAPRFWQYGRVFRPHMLLRAIEPVAGACRVRIRIRPRFAYGAVAPVVATGSNHLRFLAAGSAIRVTTDAPIAYVHEEQWFSLDRKLTFILGPDEIVDGSVSELERMFRERTEDYWCEWVRYLSVPFEWQEAVIRAAIALKLCSFEETGAIVAAMTTSIPEAPGTRRNWDYRYCWLRDAFFVVQALNRLGATRTMEDFIRYIANVAALEPDGRLKPVYGIVPGTKLPERIVADLSGYRDAAPVRVGNLAEDQTQNDGYGAAVLAAAQMFFDHRLPRPGEESLFRRLEALGARAIEAAFLPDAGLWEYRGRDAIHTHSSAMCWAACDRLAKIARVLGLAERRLYWRGEADRMREEILRRAWNEKLGRFAATLDGDGLDASLLLLQELGLVAASDPRFIATLDVIGRELRRGNLILRYSSDDGFGTPTTAFLVCTFWYVDALAAVGRRDEAREIFDYVLSRRNRLGLLSEDIDPATGELWGNFPQTYSMVGLIVSAMRLSKSWEEAFWRGW